MSVAATPKNQQAGRRTFTPSGLEVEINQRWQDQNRGLLGEQGEAKEYAGENEEPGPSLVDGDDEEQYRQDHQ